MTERTLPHDADASQTESLEENSDVIASSRTVANYAQRGKGFGRGRAFGAQPRTFEPRQRRDRAGTSMDVFVAEQHEDDPNKFTIELPRLGATYRILFGNVLYKLTRV